MTELTDITQQDAPSEVEFVDREFAEAEARRAIVLLDASDESQIEAWFALQAVADQVGPASNLGIRGLSWASKGGQNRGAYNIRVRCVDCMVVTSTGAPGTLAEACEPDRLDKARSMLNRVVEENGGLANPGRRPQGTGRALEEAAASSPEGRLWLSRRTSTRQARDQLVTMVKVADVYGRSGVYPPASRHVHQVFLPFDNRADLVREFPIGASALAKAMSLRRSMDAPPALSSPLRVPSSSAYTRLAVRAGVTPQEARIILRAVMNGRSKAKLIRAVNEAVRMVGENEPSKLLRAA